MIQKSKKDFSRASRSNDFFVTFLLFLMMDMMAAGVTMEKAATNPCSTICHRIIIIVMRSIVILVLSLAVSVVPGHALTTQLKQNQNIHQTTSESINPSRRHAMLAGLGGVASILLSQPKVASAASSGAAAFEGTFSDPINHPGGKRTIRLLPEMVGDYQLAEVVGGGGFGEPKNFLLPAMVLGDRAIIIDFSPKGGPRDFTGVLNGKDIKFLRDGNTWPRLSE